MEEVVNLIKHRRSFVTLGDDCGILKKPSKRDADPRKSSRIREEDGIQVGTLPQGEAGGVCTCFPVVSRKNLLPQTLQSGQVAVAWKTLGNLDCGNKEDSMD